MTDAEYGRESLPGYTITFRLVSLLSFRAELPGFHLLFPGSPHAELRGAFFRVLQHRLQHHKEKPPKIGSFWHFGTRYEYQVLFSLGTENPEKVSIYRLFGVRSFLKTSSKIL